MRIRRLTLDDKTCCHGEDGVLVTGEQAIDGEDYEFDDDGVLLSDKAE